MPLPLSPNAHHFSLVFATQCLNYPLCVKRGADYFGPE